MEPAVVELEVAEPDLTGSTVAKPVAAEAIVERLAVAKPEMAGPVAI